MHNMRFIFITIVILCISVGCGPSQEERVKLEEDIQSIKSELVLLLNETKELTLIFANYKTHEENIQLAENSLKKIRIKLNETNKGSKEYSDLKTLEKKVVNAMAVERESLLKIGSIDSVEIQLQNYSKKYDSLERSLKKKSDLLK